MLHVRLGIHGEIMFVVTAAGLKDKLSWGNGLGLGMWC